MAKRNSSVSRLHITSMLFGAITQIGDSTHLEPESAALAIQRKEPIFGGKEDNLGRYGIFRKPAFVFPPPFFMPAIRKRNEVRSIQVGSVHVIGISTSGILQIGNTGTAYIHSRVKHIRELPPRNSDGASLTTVPIIKIGEE